MVFSLRPLRFLAGFARNLYSFLPGFSRVPSVAFVELVAGRSGPAPRLAPRFLGRLPTDVIKWLHLSEGEIHEKCSFVSACLGFAFQHCGMGGPTRNYARARHEL